MSVDRLSVTVPAELGAALRALAEARGETVSTLVTAAIAHRVRLEALDRALEEADRRFGPLDEDLVDRTQAELVEAIAGAGRGRRKKRAR